MSIFSAEGISSASGTSEVGHVIVDELSDNSLNNLVEETAKTVRRMNLETRMFEGMSLHIYAHKKESSSSSEEKKSERRPLIPQKINYIINESFLFKAIMKD